MKIKIFKSLRILKFYKEKEVEIYPIGIGKAAIGHKEKEGDMKTPEGEYIICFKNPNSKYHLSLAINYPNNKDAKNGLDKGLISSREYNLIYKANNKKEIPLWNTALGGEIFIHGNLENGNWSKGCIRMYNSDIEKIYYKVHTKTKVIIFP